MKNVLLINGWSDDNKGDCAIVLGMVELIESAHPGARVAVVSSFAASSPGFELHYRHTRSHRSGTRVLGAVVPTKMAAGGLLGRRARRFASLLKSLFLLALAPLYRRTGVRWLLDRNERASFDAYCEADVVMGKGGHIYFATGDFASLIGLYINLHPLLLAQRLGIPTVLFGQSIGPVRGGPQRRLLGRALRRCHRIIAREAPSSRTARDVLGGTADATRVHVGWDPAFALSPEPLPEDILRVLPARFAALTLRQWSFPYAKQGGSDLYRGYLQGIARLVDWLRDAHDLPVVLVPQVIGPTAYEDDYVAWRDLQCEREVPVHEVRFDATPAQLASLYGKAEVLIGTRFHSVILAIAAGTPAIAISYHGTKAAGIMDRLGLAEYVIDMGSVDFATLRDRTDRMIQARQTLSGMLAESTRHARLDLVASMRDALQLNPPRGART